MVMRDWKKTLIASSTTMLESMQIIDESAMQIALVVDKDQKLLGMVTDGDIRRAILSGREMNVPVSEIMSKNPVCGSPDDSWDMLVNRMRSKGIHHIPVIDERGVVVDLVMAEHKGERPNWVVLMAGGLGSRLRPLTNSLPKPMLSVGNKPVLETIISQFHEFGFNHYFISLNYLAEKIKSYFADGSKWGVNITYLHENEPLGTAGALSLLEQKPEHPLILMNGDLLTKLNFDNLLNFHEKHQSLMTVCVREYSYSVPYGVLETDGVYLNSVMEKPKHNVLVNAGIYVIEPEVLDLIKPDQKIDITDIIEQLIDKGNKPSVFPIHEYWMDIGHPEDFDKAQFDFDDEFLVEK